MRIFAMIAAAAALSLAGCSTEKEGDCSTLCTEVFEECSSGCEEGGDEDCNVTCEGDRDVCFTGCEDSDEGESDADM